MQCEVGVNSTLASAEKYGGALKSWAGRAVPKLSLLKHSSQGGDWNCASGVLVIHRDDRRLTPSPLVVHDQRSLLSAGQISAYRVLASGQHIAAVEGLSLDGWRWAKHAAALRGVR